MKVKKIKFYRMLFAELQSSKHGTYINQYPQRLDVGLFRVVHLAYGQRSFILRKEIEK